MKNENVEKYDPANIALKDIDFLRMYDTYYSPLCRFAEKFVNQDAEDIVQELFKILWEKRNTLRIIGKVSSYLYQSVRNISYSYLAEMKKLFKYYEYVQSILNSGDESLTHDDNDPLTMQITSESANGIDAVIGALPPQCRKILLLWNEEFSYQEIAQKLGITINTVRTQITRTKTKLRKLLENKE